MTETEVIDFGGVDAAEGSALGSNSKYLTPGMYRISFTEATHGLSGIKKTPYMEVKYVSHSKNEAYNEKEGRAKFYLTTNAFSRVQYFHTAFIGKKLDKKFKSTEEIVAYFDLVFKSDAGKKLIKPCVVSGSISTDGSKLFSDLAFTGWVLNEDDFEEGAFEVNSDTFRSAITSDVKFFKPDAPTSDSDIITSTDEASTKAPWDN